MVGRRRIVIVLLVLAALAAGVWLLTRPSSQSDRLVLHGNVDLRQVSLAFTQSGRVVEMRAEEGEAVRRGQVLALLDTETLRLQIARAQAESEVREQAALALRNGARPQEIAQAEAAVAAARAEADNAAEQLRRLSNVAETTYGRAVSRQDLDAARARRRIASAQLDSAMKARDLVVAGPRREAIGQAEAELGAARAGLAELRHQLAEAELRAPLSGVIRARLMEPGDMASPQRPAYALALRDPKWVRAYLSETDLGRVRPGMSASIATDSHPEAPLKGHVGYISSVAEFTPRNVETEELRTSLVYEVRIFVDDPRDRLRLGMPATVTLAVAANR